MAAAVVNIAAVVAVAAAAGCSCAGMDQGHMPDCWGSCWACMLLHVPAAAAASAASLWGLIY